MKRAGGPGFWGKTALLVRKDLTLELRAPDTLVPMVTFSIAVTLLLAFVLPASSRGTAPARLPTGAAAVADVVAGFLWVTVLFAGLVGFARTWAAERDDGAIDPLLLVPVDRTSLFLAKAGANLAFIGALQLLLLPLFLLLFSVAWDPALAVVVALADIGFVAIGTLFSSIAAQTRSRELLLPILALPALVPVFIAATELTSSAFAGASLADLAGRGWFGILVFFDVVFTIAAALLFELAID